MIDVLQGLGNSRFGLDGLLEDSHGSMCGDFERQEISIHLSGSSDVESDMPIGDGELADEGCPI